MDDLGAVATEDFQPAWPAAAAGPPTSTTAPTAAITETFPALFGAEVYGALLKEHYDSIQELVADPSSLDPELIDELRLHRHQDLSPPATSSPSSSERKRVRLPPSPVPALKPQAPHPAEFVLFAGLPSIEPPGTPGESESDLPPGLPASAAPVAPKKGDRRKLRNITYKLNPPAHVREKKAERSSLKFEARQEQALVQPLPASISETERRGEWAA
ncbi:hypothetical protein FRC01_010919, partial [Tulasnella sp. 417]